MLFTCFNCFQVQTKFVCPQESSFLIYLFNLAKIAMSIIILDPDNFEQSRHDDTPTTYEGLWCPHVVFI